MPRIEYEGAVYHVIHRGNNKEYIFEKPNDKLYFLGIINNIKDSMGIVLMGFVIMNNHYHLLLKTEKQPLSLVMHRLNSSYARYYNKKRNRTGHVFEGRYKSILITDELYLLSVLRYIHLNPVKAGIVKKSIDYEFSSDRYYRKNNNHFVDIDLILDMISEKRSEAAKQYIDLMKSEEMLTNADFKNIEVMGKVDSKKKNQPKNIIRKTLDELLLMTGAEKKDIKLIKCGSRKRRLTSYKIKYTELAQREGYTIREIAKHIGISEPALYRLRSRNNQYV